jgi:hypothetical protein
MAPSELYSVTFPNAVLIVIKAVLVLISCGSGCVHICSAVVNLLTNSSAPSKTEISTLTLGPIPSSGESNLIVRGKDNQMKDLQSCILGHWVHSHEEDEQGIMVYRPKGYNFPPSRGRIRFDFREGGELVYFGIGRADGYEQLSGSWVIEEENRVRINVNSDRIRPFVLHVISCDDQALKVKLD